MVKLGNFVCGGCGQLYLAMVHVHGHVERSCPFCGWRGTYRHLDKIRLGRAIGRSVISVPAGMADEGLTIIHK